MAAHESDDKAPRGPSGTRVPSAVTPPGCQCTSNAHPRIAGPISDFEAVVTLALKLDRQVKHLQHLMALEHRRPPFAHGTPAADAGTKGGKP
jgi:hypothetical protein